MGLPRCATLMHALRGTSMSLTCVLSIAMSLIYALLQKSAIECVQTSLQAVCMVLYPKKN